MRGVAFPPLRSFFSFTFVLLRRGSQSCGPRDCSLALTDPYYSVTRPLRRTIHPTTAAASSQCVGVTGLHLPLTPKPAPQMRRKLSHNRPGVAGQRPQT